MGHERGTDSGGREAVFYPPPDWVSMSALEASSPLISLSKTSAGSWSIRGLQKEQLVVIYPQGAVPTTEELTLKPALGESRFFNWWGQHPGGAGRDDDLDLEVS